ncbi:endonuclease/exonuclease/phosphatase family protein [Niabella ginsengisoli]|uniref:Endonuclease/exonuclease/phosphatase family protein n=1 Tax=Niabella ginsengisoli TaxID=522298 RepID=A0ABS9SNE2_9BACT|nr:endonuclease/exonuclease/phosphatase family protein [Niabella ginsengisoli]MCH5599796.1 endonuclease/exonuclease/phosphatase family protein [Niabella ginsengisoli]
MTTSRRKFLQSVGLTATAASMLPTLGWLKPSAAPRTFHRVLSSNIRVALPEDEAKGRGWSHRKEVCLQVIKKQQPDIVCFQEVLKVQAEDIRKAFPSFQLLGFDGPEMDAYKEGYHGIAKNPILFQRSDTSCWQRAFTGFQKHRW